MSFFDTHFVEHEHYKDEDVLRLSQDNPRFFAILVDRYQDAFFRTANRILHHKEESEEVCQEAFIKIYTNARKFTKQPGIELKSWMYKILVNTALMHYRKLKRRRGVIEYNDVRSYENHQASSPRDAPDQLAKEHETRELIERAISDMPQELGAVLRAHYLNDRSYQTIAKEQATTVGAVKMKLFRARKIFKHILSSYEL